MAAFSHPAYFVLDPFLEPERFNSMISTTNPCFSPIHLSNDQYTTHPFPFNADQISDNNNIPVPSNFTRESHPLNNNVHEKLSSQSWLLNDLDLHHQDSSLIINPVHHKRKHLDMKEEEERKPEKQLKQNYDSEKTERKRQKPRVRKEKKVPDQQLPTNYVHVRARRGEATDPHSLAERVRRKKINVRMKLLQSLVPGCDKLTGKALILDEIIRYVILLQNQVEGLASKVAPDGMPNGVNYYMNTQVAKELFSTELQDSNSTQLISFMEATPVSMLQHHQREASNVTTQLFNYD